MEKFMMFFAGIVLVFIIVIAIFSFVSKDEPNPYVVEKWAYIPMVYVNNNLYCQRGNVVYSIPDGWEYYGSILKQVSQTDSMIKEELYSNTIEVGSRVFLNKKDLHKIYVEITLNEKIIYLEYKND